MSARRSILLLVVALGWLLTPSTAHADPPGPTDYRSRVTAVTPPTDVIAVTVEGGDAFLRIEVQPNHEVVILGYDDEPYVRIRPTGIVEQNRRSYATYYNEARYGRTDIPPIVDNDADPEWEVVGDGGTWTWHDHRAHWMGTEPPIGLDPGESLPAQDVPLLVDGAPVAVSVQVTLVAAPSKFPVVVGLAFGIGLALLGVLLGPASATTAMLLIALASTAVGAGQYLSVPVETGRAATWWLLPGLAVLFLVAAIVTYGRSRLVVAGLTAVAAAQVLLWAIRRRTGLTRPVLPTDLPGGFDRFVTAAALGGGVVVLVATIRSMFLQTPPVEQHEG